MKRESKPAYERAVVEAVLASQGRAGIVSSRDPSHPDVHVELSDGQVRDYEVVDVTDQDVEKDEDHFERLHAALRDQFDALPSDEHEQLGAAFAGCVVTVQVEHAARTRKARTATAVATLKWLLARPSFRGFREFYDYGKPLEALPESLREDAAPTPGMQYLAVFEIGAEGVRFGSMHIAIWSPGGLLDRAVAEKSRKRYDDGDAPRDLVCHFPRGMFDHEASSLQSTRALRDADFENVILYAHDRTVTFAIPD